MRRISVLDVVRAYEAAMACFWAYIRFTERGQALREKGEDDDAAGGPAPGAREALVEAAQHLIDAHMQRPESSVVPGPAPLHLWETKNLG
jgi:hypothetical protein